MSSLERFGSKKKMPASKPVKQRQALYAQLKALGVKIEWRTSSVKMMQEYLAKYNQAKMDKIYNFVSTNQLKRIDARNIRAIQSLPEHEQKEMSILQFNRILSKLPAGEERYLLVHIKDDTGNIVRSITLSGHQLGANMFVSVEEGTVSDADVVITSLTNGSVSVEWVQKAAKTAKRSEFFRYLTKEYYGLEDFQVYNKFDSSNKENQIPCFIFALQMAGVSKSKLSSITSTMYTYAATHDFIKKTAIAFDLHIKVLTYKEYEGRFDFTRSSFGDKTLPAIELGCIGQHLFHIKQTNISKAAIEHPEFASHKSFPSIYLRNGRAAKGTPKMLMSHQVIAQLYFKRSTLLTPITLENAPKLLNNKYADVDSLTELALSKNWFKRIGLTKEEIDGEIYTEGEKFGTPPFKVKTQKGSFVPDDYEVVYFDLETFSDTTENIHARFPDIKHKGQDHIPYCASWKRGNNSTQVSFGLNCVKVMLDALPPNGNYLMLAHNAGFDVRFLIHHMTSFDKKMGVIEGGTHMKQLIASYKNKRIVVKDTMSFIAGSLAGMPAMFPGACDEITLEKESFPHELMNTQTFDSEIEVSDETLIANATRINAMNGDKLKVKLYAMHYCKRDVDVLAACFNRFRTMFMDRFKQDVFNHISMPGLAYAILNNEGCYDDCYSMSGPCLSFVRKAIVGGRVMTRDNEKHHTTHEVVDFDAVSLYPSAMARLPGFAKGKPKIHQETIPECSYYISKVKILSVGKNLHFPLQSIKLDGESRDFTNDLVGKEIIMDQYALEDLVKFQGATYEVIEGLYWNDGFNPEITTSIIKLFNERLQLKVIGNPLQGGIKLLMNASYGKLCQKPIVKQKTIIRGSDEIDQYTRKRISRLIQRTPITDEIAMFEEHKPLSRHFSPAHLGVQILSMSKRIMNEVMCLAEEKDLKIWYQDTDSMHIDRDSLTQLTTSFKERYSRDLVGTQLGQFHSDFDLDGSKGEVYATESYFIGKKTYLDFLACDGNDTTGYHKRMKGIPSKLITDPRSTYEGLFNGIDQSFDLTQACPIKIDSKTQRVMKRNEFIRKVSA